MGKLIIFDLDGTLQEKWDDQLMPGVAEWFSEWMALEEGDPMYRCQFGIATNQGGVGLRKILERNGKDGAKYPTRDEVVDRLRNISKRLVGNDAMFLSVAALNYQDKNGEWAIDYDPDQHFSWWNPEFRKPGKAMLEFIMDLAHASPEETTMVGDSDDDRLAAEKAGVRFEWAKSFFKWEG